MTRTRWPRSRATNPFSQIIYGDVLPVERVDGKRRGYSGARQFGFRDVVEGALAFWLADGFPLHLFLKLGFGGGVLLQLCQGFAIGEQSFREISNRCKRLGEFVMGTSRELVLVLVAALI
jgi:hypothetical protein